MAIKSKKRRSKPRPAARAPKREPVPVPVPVLQRRWVQVTAAFVAGVFAMVVFVWITNGLRSDGGSEDAAARRTAATEYRSAVEDALSPLGMVTPGAPPTVLPDVATALQQMQQGSPPDDAAATFRDAAAGAKAAAKTIRQLPVADMIRDRGFDRAQATLFTGSAQQLALALDGFRRCADAGTAALDASGGASRSLVTTARGICRSAQAQLIQAWAAYEGALASGGIVQAPPAPPAGATGLIPGLDPNG